MIEEFKDPRNDQHEKFKEQRLNLVKDYSTKQNIEYKTIQGMVMIDLANMTSQQYREIKRILSGKYDNENLLDYTGGY